MSKLHIKFTHFVVSSVTLFSDEGLGSENLSFSLRHKGVRKFFDGDGEFCTGEMKFSVNIEPDTQEHFLKSEVFSKVEDFDKLQLAIYESNKQLFCWDFSWPDIFGENELDIELDLITDRPDQDDEVDVDNKIDDEPINEPDDGNEIKDGGEDEEGEENNVKLGVKPASPKGQWKRVGVLSALAFAMVVIIGFIIFETGLLDQKFGSMSKEQCMSLSVVTGAMESEEKKSDFFDLCANSFVQLTEREFGDVLATLTRDKSMLVVAGRLFDVPSDNNFLKMLRPETDVNLPLAVEYYSAAKAVNVAGASDLLMQACDKIKIRNDTFDLFVVKKICKFSD